MLANAKNERSEGEGEAPQAMPAEGATRANAKNERSEGEGEGYVCYRPLLGERSESLSGEALRLGTGGRF